MACSSKLDPAWLCFDGKKIVQFSPRFVQLPRRRCATTWQGCATFLLYRKHADSNDGAKLTPSNEMCNFVCYPGQLHSSWSTTFPCPWMCFTVCCIGQLPNSGCATSDTATANYFTSDVHLSLIPRGCVISLLAPGPNHPSSTILISRPVYMQLFTTLMNIWLFTTPRECKIFIIQLSLPMRYATSYVAPANCLADFVQLHLLPPPTETIYP